MLATFRLTRLITVDVIGEPLRERVAHRPWLGYLAHCPWCLSIWLAPFPAVVVWWPTNRLLLAGLLALSASAVTGLIAQREPD